jgi:hypothetical protein
MMWTGMPAVFVNASSVLVHNLSLTISSRGLLAGVFNV